LHSCKHNDEVQFYAFEVLVADGGDVRPLPLSVRKRNVPPVRSAFGRSKVRSASACSGMSDLTVTPPLSPQLIEIADLFLYIEVMRTHNPTEQAWILFHLYSQSR
jgi:hypothetical protein